MRIKLIAFGTKMPSWVTESFQEYTKRLPQDFYFELRELPLQKRGKNGDLKRILQRESQTMLNEIDNRHHCIALDMQGKSWDTETLSQKLQTWQSSGQDICFLIGSPEGLSTECKARANQCWSLSALTLPHPLVRVILAEQLYRSWSLLNRHPYHR